MNDLRRKLDTYNDWEEPDWEPCAYCGGTGACYPCVGKGTMGSQNETTCPACHGNGLCAACGGMGQDIPAVPHDQFDNPPETWDLPL